MTVLKIPLFYRVSLAILSHENTLSFFRIEYVRVHFFDYVCSCFMLSEDLSVHARLIPKHMLPVVDDVLL